jgi:hypothetical protein
MPASWQMTPEPPPAQLQQWDHRLPASAGLLDFQIIPPNADVAL